MESPFPIQSVAAISGEAILNPTIQNSVLALPEKAEQDFSTPQEQVVNDESANAAEAVQTAFVPTDPLPAEPAISARKPRVNPGNDGVWPRHHAFCIMGIACDLALGGFDAARTGANPLKGCIKATEPGKKLLEICPWVLNANYLNLAGSHVLNKHGLERCFKEWAANRVYYFYYGGEHPALRKRDNISAVYRQFHDEFVTDVAAGEMISEARARQFWESVSAQVPFKEPSSGMALPVGVISTAPAPVNADVGNDDQVPTPDAL